MCNACARSLSLYRKEEAMLDRISQALAMLARLERESGQALAEYGLLLALIAMVCVLAVTALGLAVSGIFGGINGAL